MKNNGLRNLIDMNSFYGVWNQEGYDYHIEYCQAITLFDYNKDKYNYSVEDTAKLQQLIDSGQFELAEQLQIGLIELYNKTN